MRGLVLGCSLTLGVFAVFGFAIYFGIAAQSWAAFGATLLFGGVLLVVLYKMLDAVGRVDMNPWLMSIGDCHYKYAWDGSGIAVNAATRELHLASRFDGKIIKKTYSFPDVREWSYEIPGKTIQRTGTVIGGGLQGAGHNVGAAAGDSIANIASAINAQENTGLTLLVRDIDYPKWFIRFKADRNTKTELLRWMEILQQHINEGLAPDLGTLRPQKGHDEIAFGAKAQAAIHSPSRFTPSHRGILYAILAVLVLILARWLWLHFIVAPQIIHLLHHP